MYETIATVLRAPDLRGRILFTLAMLAVFRLGIFIPAPGVDRLALADFFQSNQGTLLGLYDMFSGGALEQFSVFVLGIMPYISASIIMQVLGVVLPQIERMKNEGQQGRNRINQYTRYLMIVIALVQALTISIGLESQRTMSGADLVIDGGWGFRLMTMMTMTAGSCFVMWLGEQITERGIGNGSSMIITAGILAAAPAGLVNTWRQVSIGEITPLMISLIGAGMLLVMMGIVFVERGQRRIPIQYAKRVVGRRIYGGQATHLPLKMNISGVIPPIFASSVLMFPATLGTFGLSFFDVIGAELAPGKPTYILSYVTLIVVFAFFYTAVVFNPVDVAENLRKQGGYIPGIRPGKQTAEYLDRILTRLTAGGAIYLAAVCIMPTLLVTQYGVPFYFGGTGLLIVVGVCLDTVAQIEGHLLTRHYDGAVSSRSGRVRGRRGRIAQ